MVNGEQTRDKILAYAVELTGTQGGTIRGNLYELDYQQHFQYIRDAALPVGANRLIMEPVTSRMASILTEALTGCWEISCGMRPSPMTRLCCRRLYGRAAQPGAGRPRRLQSPRYGFA